MIVNKICLNNKFSTTRCLVEEKPEIINNPEDKFKSVLFLPENKNRKGEGGLRTQGYFKRSFGNKPLISVITVVYNNEAFLEETILSVINQTYDNIEYIIIDGGSTDGTLDIIKKYENKIDYWVSERDKGIYDAMNKGLRVATGYLIAFLNSDDFYKLDAIKTSLKTLMKENKDYVIANIKFTDGFIMKPFLPLKRKIYQEMPYPHVTAIIPLKIYKRVGLFYTNFKIAGDHDMAVRIILAGFENCHNNNIVAVLRKGGVSSGIYSNFESMKVAVKNGKNKFLAYITLSVQIVKKMVENFLPPKIVGFIMKLKKSRCRYKEL